MAGLLATLVRPDREDDPERGIVIQAANILQIGEFQFLQLAYREWFGHDMPPEEVDGHFRHFILKGQTPHWVLQYAERIIDWDARDLLDERNPDYRRFDNLHYSRIPRGVRQFAVAVACVALVLGGGLMISHYGAHKSMSVLPPFFDEKDLPQVETPGELRGS
ncbi:MAG: hypothetical protein JSU82_00305 [Rhodospirillales bacterium]|nr:MAG: hypothetical protein JSU82_00305 [Rhodospirillales bacterium]